MECLAQVEVSDWTSSAGGCIGWKLQKGKKNTVSNYIKRFS